MEISQDIKNQICEDDSTKSIEVEIRNRAEIIGYIDSEPTVSHQVNNESIYEFTVKVPRLKKDVYDFINVQVPERGNDIKDLSLGTRVRIEGSYRSSNRKGDDGKLHTFLFIFTDHIEVSDDNHKVNTVKLHGVICKPPRFRTTPTGKDICDVMVAVNRNYNRCDYIPCIAWGRDAKYISDFKEGDIFYIVGRIQSRVYKKKFDENNFVERMVNEVSITELKSMGEGDKIYEEKIIDVLK